MTASLSCSECGQPCLGWRINLMEQLCNVSWPSVCFSDLLRNRKNWVSLWACNSLFLTFAPPFIFLVCVLWQIICFLVFLLQCILEKKHKYVLNLLDCSAILLVALFFCCICLWTPVHLLCCVRTWCSDAYLLCICSVSIALFTFLWLYNCCFCANFDTVFLLSVLFCDSWVWRQF